MQGSSQATRGSPRHLNPGDLVRVDAGYVGKLKGVGMVWHLTTCDARRLYAVASLVPRVTHVTAVRFLWTSTDLTSQRAGHEVRVVLTDGPRILWSLWQKEPSDEL